MYFSEKNRVSKNGVLGPKGLETNASVSIASGGTVKSPESIGAALVWGKIGYLVQNRSFGCSGEGAASGRFLYYPIRLIPSG